MLILVMKMKPAIAKVVSLLVLFSLAPCLVLFFYSAPLNDSGLPVSLLSLDVCSSHDIHSAGIAYALVSFSLLILFFPAIHRLPEIGNSAHLSILSYSLDKPPLS